MQDKLQIKFTAKNQKFKAYIGAKNIPASSFRQSGAFRLNKK